MSFFTRGGIFSGRDGALTRRGALGRSLTLPKGGLVVPAYMTGTPMDTLALSVQPGFYPFAASSYSRQMQASDDGLSGWANTSGAFSGASFAISGLTGKYLRVVETAKSASGASLTSTSPALGPVVVFVALPATPLATGARALAMGDSLFGYNNWAGAALLTTDAAAPSYAYGQVEQAFALDPRFNFDSWYDTTDPLGRNLQGANQGVHGDHIDNMVSRFSAQMARAGRPPIALFLGGTNTISSGDSGRQDAAYVVSKINEGLIYARNAGTIVVMSTLYPRGDWLVGDPRQQTLLDVNTWIRAQAGRSGVYVWDAWADLTSGGAQIASYFNADLVHNNPVGAYRLALSLNVILGSLVSAGSVFSQDPQVANLFPSAVGNLTGTTGTKTGTPAPTGSVAANVTVNNGRNLLAVVCSKEVISESLERQVITLTPNPAGDSQPNYQANVVLPIVTTGLPSALDWIYADAFLELDDGVALVRMDAAVAQSGTKRAGALSFNAFSPNFVNVGAGQRSLWCVSKPFQVPSGVTFNQLTMTLAVIGPKSASGPIVAKISRPIWRKVADPRAAWGYPTS